MIIGTCQRLAKIPRNTIAQQLGQVTIARGIGSIGRLGWHRLPGALLEIEKGT
jgi:hypothetical protein